MKIITDERCAGYHTPGHPERPARITRSHEMLQTQTVVPLEWLAPGPSDEVAILRAHTPKHLARLEQPLDFDADTAYHDGIATYARASVGAALQALDLACKGNAVFSLMRPPGHHALPERAMGFCYLGNIGIATLHALSQGVERVAVFDFDVHHGNGTESILLNRKGASFYSIHQSPCYPGTGLSDAGNNCFNFTVPPGVPRTDYRRTLQRAFDAMMARKPEVIGVSAGFDAYARDPLAQGTLEAEDFHWLGDKIRRTGVPAFSLLEGGYSKDLPQLILAYLQGVSGL